MVLNQILLELWENHRGKILGIASGLLLGCLILVFGFWRSIFVLLCIAVGYLIGNRYDEKGSLKDIYERVFER